MANKLNIHLIKPDSQSNLNSDIQPEYPRPFWLDDIARHMFQCSDRALGIVSINETWLAVNDALCRLLKNSERKLVFHSIAPIFDSEEWVSLRSHLPNLWHGAADRLTCQMHIGGVKKSKAHLNISVIRSMRGQPLYYYLEIRDLLENDYLSLQSARRLKSTTIESKGRSVSIRKLKLYRGGKAATKSFSSSPKGWEANGELVPRQSVSSEQIDLYKSLVEQAHVGIYVCKNKELFYLNRRCAEMLGYTEEELIGRDLLDLIYPEDRPQMINYYSDCISDSKPALHFQIRGLKKNGDLIHLEGHGYIISHNGEQMTIGTCWDVTERKRTEEMLRRSDKLSVVGQLAAGVAHEIRNPLTSIKGFLHLMKNRKQENPMYLDIMDSELERIQFIVNEFLLMAQPHSVQFRSVQLHSLLGDIVNRLEPQAFSQKIHIHTEFGNRSPLVYGEEQKLKQAFINIVQNALDAMPTGGDVYIRVQLKGDRTVIRFEDSGRGIPEERLKKLGEPFYVSHEKGSGFGLMMSFKIIEAHEGKVKINSILNVGTVVEVSLPAVSGEDKFVGS